MRAETIWNVIKTDWYERRWMILSCLFIPLLVELVVMWQGLFIYDWFRDILGVDNITVTLIFSVLCVFFAYILLNVFVITRLAGEADAGFYRLVRILPITVEEVVTARFISSFVLSVGGILWFALLLGVYAPGISQPVASGIWTAFYLNAFLFPAGLAVYHGLFFRSGTKGTVSAFFLFFFVIIAMRSNTAEYVVQTFDSMLYDYPLIITGIGAVLLIAIWLLCWRWSMTAYRKYLEGKSKPAKKQQTRRAAE